MSDQLTVGILGASGFIGSRLVEWLILHNLAEVRPIVRSFKGMARLARFELDVRLADGMDQAALAEAMQRCDVLFHCVVGGRDTILKSAEVAYLAAAKARVRRLVYLSSAVVHGHNPTPETDENSQLVTRQPFEYNISKVKAEHILRRLRSDGSVQVVVLRPMIVFGPRSQFWSAQIAADLLSGKAYLIDGGSGICNSVYVDNLVHAMWLAAVVPNAANQDFLITDGEQVTWWDLYSAVAGAVGVDMSGVPCLESAALARICHEPRDAPLKMAGKRFAWAIRESLPPTLIARVRQVLPPGSIKALGRWSASPLPEPGSTPPKNSRQPFPRIDHEIASLQQCRYMLPIERARELLGYTPPVVFAEGCRRTMMWLRYVLGMSR